MSIETTTTDEPMTGEELAAIKARYDRATPGAWHFEEQYGPYFLASEVHGYMRGVGQLEFGEGDEADRDREFVLHAHADMAALLDEVDRLRAESERLHAQLDGAREEWGVRYPGWYQGEEDPIDFCDDRDDAELLAKSQPHAKTIVVRREATPWRDAEPKAGVS